MKGDICVEGFTEYDAYTRIIIYKGQGEIGLVLALIFLPKKTSPGT